MAEIRYGFHGADLFAGQDDDLYDVAASAQKYADQVKAKLEESFPGDEAEVVFDTDAGGVLPGQMQAAVDGFTDHDDVPMIEHIAGQVYEAFGWTVEAHCKNCYCPKCN